VLSSLLSVLCSRNCSFPLPSLTAVVSMVDLFEMALVLSLLYYVLSSLVAHLHADSRSPHLYHLYLILESSQRAWPRIALSVHHLGRQAGACLRTNRHQTLWRSRCISWLPPQMSALCSFLPSSHPPPLLFYGLLPSRFFPMLPSLRTLQSTSFSGFHLLSLKKA